MTGGLPHTFGLLPPEEDFEMTPEGRVKSMVNNGLAPLVTEGLVWKYMPVPMGMGLPSLDYLLCCNGRFVVIETKVKGKTLTPRQTVTKQTMEAAGAIVFVVDDAQSCANAMVVIRGLCGWGMMKVPG